MLIDAGPPIRGLLGSVGVRPDDVTAIFLTHRHRDAAGGLHTMPEERRIIFPRRPGVTICAGHRFEAVRVPHDILRRARIAVLDGSGWERAFPTHQPMVKVIPIVKALSNLTRIVFTHVGHTGMSHAELERRTRALGDRRFGIAYHGLRIHIR